MPGGTGTSMPLSLALGTATHLLAIAGSSVGLKPTTTNSTRTLLDHGRLLPR
jgi:hypothetical protein